MLTDSADVVVVGAGLAGLGVAWFLAARGVRVVVVEARERALLGASGRHPGGLHLGFAEHPWRLEASLGTAAAGGIFRFAREGVALAREHLGASASGGLWVAADAGEAPQIDASVAALERMGVPVEARSSEDVAASLGTSAFGAGFFLPDEGAVEAASLRAFADRVATRVPVLTGFPVSRVDVADGVTVRGPDRAVHAEIAVLAAGAGLPAVDRYFEDKVFPYREQALVTAPSAGATSAGSETSADPKTSPGPVCRTGQGWTQWRPLPDGRLVVSGMRWATPHLEEGETEEVVVEAVQARIREFVGKRFPARASAGFERAWAWIDAKSCDGLPLVGPLPGQPRLVACAAFAGSEPALGLRAARAVADGILEGRAPGVPAAFEPARLA